MEDFAGAADGVAAPGSCTSDRLFLDLINQKEAAQKQSVNHCVQTIIDKINSYVKKCIVEIYKIYY